VFGIVRQSGGTIWVHSEPDRGATFKVYLPADEARADPRRASASITTLFGTETILVVEDEDQVRSVACGILKRLGYRVIEAGAPADAISLCATFPDPIHLLLSDVVMPQMNGPELARRLTEVRPDMKVLCMSGYTDDAVVRHGVLGSDVPYLQKPLTPKLVGRRVREVLDTPVGAERAPRLLAAGTTA
jgi:CheY-like chemotaxis protein